MAALDQFQSRLGLADAAVTGQKNADAVYIHQNAVDRDAGRQAHIEPAEDLRHKGAGRLRGQIHGHPVFAADLHNNVVRIHPSGKDQRHLQSDCC